MNSFDAAGRIAGQQTLAGVGGGTRPAVPLVERRYGYSSADLITRVTDSQRGELSYSRNVTGQVTGVVGQSRQERYDYDVCGNIAAAQYDSHPVAGAGGGAAGFVPDGAALTMGSGLPAGSAESAPSTEGVSAMGYVGLLPTRVGNRRYHYDPDGRLLRVVVKRLSRKPEVWDYEWDDYDRLRAVSTPDGSRWCYRYDGFGRRVAKEHYGSAGVLVETTWFMWEGERLIEADTTVAEDGAGGREVLTWVYGDGEGAEFRPVSQAVTRFSGQELVDQQFYGIVTDLVGCPSELVDTDTGEVAGRATTTLWGHTCWQGVETPLRFPGQYYDRETGYHYNRYRYYDPHTGGYLTTDPLGLAAAPNPRTYPPDLTSWIDPLGLMSCDPHGRPHNRRNPNKMDPDYDAKGDHTVFRVDENGRVTDYQTFCQNERVRDGWQLGPRFRGTGGDHGPYSPPLFYPKGHGTAFPATGTQLPRGYN